MDLLTNMSNDRDNEANNKRTLNTTQIYLHITEYQPEYHSS